MFRYIYGCMELTRLAIKMSKGKLFPAEYVRNLFKNYLQILQQYLICISHGSWMMALHTEWSRLLLFMFQITYYHSMQVSDWIEGWESVA